MPLDEKEIKKYLRELLRLYDENHSSVFYACIAGALYVLQLQSNSMYLKERRPTKVKCLGLKWFLMPIIKYKDGWETSEEFVIRVCREYCKGNNEKIQI